MMLSTAYIPTGAPQLGSSVREAVIDEFRRIGIGFQSVGETKYKTADEIRVSTETLSDDGDLAGWSLEGDTAYILEAFLTFSCASATPDVKWIFQYSNAPQGNSNYQYSAAQNDVITKASYSITTGTAVDIPIGAVGSDGNAAVHIVGTIRSNATTGGTVDFQWAQNTDNANQMSLEAGSWIRITKLGAA